MNRNVSTDAVALRSARAAVQALPFAVSATVAVGALVALSAVVRFLLALAHPTPLLMADEYIYSTLAYELATSGAPTIRGEPASFPALLEPILTAPFWLLGDAGVALRLTQALNAVAMSLAAVPVFLLARFLGLRPALAVASAALALLVPDFFYVAFILGEPIAYPLVLAAVYAGVRALTHPTRQWQLAFFVFAGLASFARIQFVVLPLAYAGAALLVRADWRRLRLSLVLLALGAAAVAVKGLGYYSGIADFRLDVGGIVHWVATDAMLLAYAAGWLIVPGALVALATPVGRTERVFAALTVFLTLGLFAEASLYATNADRGPGGRFQERYLFALLPLLVLAFCLSLSRGRRARWAVGAGSALLVVLSARFPLSAWTDRHGRQDSPLLTGVSRLEEALGTGTGALVVALVVAALSAGAALVAYRPRFVLPALAAVGVLLAAVGLGAWSIDAKLSQAARDFYLPADARWVDNADLGDATFVNTPGSPRAFALENMFWNRSITQLVRLRRADSPDAFVAPRARVTGDGTLLVRGRPLRTPLVVSEYAFVAEFRDAVSVAKTDHLELWRPAGTPRLRYLVGGHYFDGWLANTGFVRTWASRGSTVRLRLSLPEGVPPSRVRFAAGGERRVVTVSAEAPTVVEFRVDREVWTLRWKAPQYYLEDGRPIGVRADSLAVREG